MQSQHVKTKIEKSLTRYLFGENVSDFGLLLKFLCFFNGLILTTLVFYQSAVSVLCIDRKPDWYVFKRLFS